MNTSIGEYIYSINVKHIVARECARMTSKQYFLQRFYCVRVPYSSPSLAGHFQKATRKKKLFLDGAVSFDVTIMRMEHQAWAS